MNDAIWCVILVFLGEIFIWFGFYYLSAKAYIRSCQEDSVEPKLWKLRISYIICFIMFHLFILWMGYELVEWGGMD